MAPRSYTQGRRAESADATRGRILVAATDLYRERGVAATTMAAIAERADVARGTLLHHFGGADGILEAVALQLMVTLELPDERVLEGIEDRDARVRAYVEAMVRFFERSTPWWQVFESEMQRPAMQAGEAEYFSGLSRLQALAVGDAIAADLEAMTTLGALVHPGTLGSFLWVLETAGIGSEDRIRIVGDLVLGYLDQRAARPPNGRPS